MKFKDKIKSWINQATDFNKSDSQHLIGGKWSMMITCASYLFSGVPWVGIVVGSLLICLMIVWEILQKTGNTLREQISDVLKGGVGVLFVVFVFIRMLTTT